MRPHLEYTCTLCIGSLHLQKHFNAIESVEKFACIYRVCLKWWNLDYESMLHMLGITQLSNSTCQQYLKLVATGSISLQEVCSWWWPLFYYSAERNQWHLHAAQHSNHSNGTKIDVYFLFGSYHWWVKCM